MKIFILSDTGKLYVFSTVDALTSVPVSSSATGVAFSADGSFAYVAGSPGSNISAFSTCEIPPVGSVDLGNVSTAGIPRQILPLPNVHEAILGPEQSGITQNVLAVEPPNIQLLTAQFTRTPLPKDQFTCNLPMVSFGSIPPVNLGQGNFTPLLMQVTGDGSQVIIVAKNIPAVLIFDVNAGTTTAIPLANNASPLAHPPLSTELRSLWAHVTATLPIQTPADLSTS